MFVGSEKTDSGDDSNKLQLQQNPGELLDDFDELPIGNEDEGIEDEDPPEREEEDIEEEAEEEPIRFISTWKAVTIGRRWLPARLVI